MNNTPVSQKFAHTGTPPLRDGKDRKHLPPQPQAPLLSDVPAEPSPAGAAGSRLRDRVRRRGEQEAGEAPIGSHKRAKVPVDYARMDAGSSNEDDSSPSAREDIKSGSGARPARASKRKDRKSEDSDYEVERESSEPTKAAKPIKRRKAARPTATPLTMDASQPVAELRRLLGLRPGWDGAPQGGSSSSSAPAQLSVAQIGALAAAQAAAQAAAREFAPAIDAQTLSQTLREAFAKNQRGLGKLCAALDEIVPSLRHLPPGAFEVAARAIGQLTAYRPAASAHVATHLCEWCASLGEQGATFARLLIDEMGDRIYEGGKGKKQRQTVVDDLLGLAPNQATAGVWNAVLRDSLAHDDVDGLDRLILRVVEHGKDSAMGQQFFQCLGALCRGQAVPADRLCELVGPLLGTQARASNGEGTATRTAYLRAGFTAFCEGLWAQGLDRAQHNALVELWLSPRGPEELLARQRVMGPELVKRRPPTSFSAFVESTRTKVPEFRKYASLVMGTLAHLLEASKSDPAEREGIAQVLPSCLDLLLAAFSLDECAQLLRQASAELVTTGDREALAAFFGELLSQVHRLGMLAPGGDGQALLSAALERPASNSNSSARADGYFSALVDFCIGMPAPTLTRLAQLGAQASSRSTAPQAVQKEGHVLLKSIFNKYASTPGLPMAPLVEGFVGGLVGRLDLEYRLARFFNGLAQGLTADDGAAARTIGHAMAVGLGGAAIGAASMDACMAALAPRLRLLPAECVTDFVEGLVSGLGGASLPLERVRQITRALTEARAQSDGEPHTNDNQARITFRAELGALRFNQALAVTQRPWDLPGAAGAPPVSLLTDASTRIAALRAAIDTLGAAPTARPPLAEVCAHDREAARLWLALESERRALHTSAAPSEHAAMDAELEEALAQLQPHLPAPQAGLTPEAVAQHVKQFQRRDTTGLDSAAQTHDALVLGWRLGLGREADAGQPLARAAVAQRTHRLFQLAAPPATGAGTDPIVTGLLQAAIRPRNAMAANAALLRPLIEHALDAAAGREAPPDRAARLALVTRIATTVEWTLRSATALCKPDELAEWSAYHLWLHPGERLARQWADGAEQPWLMASCVARAVDARNRDAALRQLVVHAAKVSDTAARPLGRGLAEAIGRGEPLQRALRFAAALPEARGSFEFLVTGLCHHEAAADVLFKAARDFSPAQKVALLRHTNAFTGIRRSFAQHLAAPPPEGHPRHCGEPALTIRETRDWALAWAVAGKAAQVPDLGALKAEFNGPVPPASLPGTSGPAVVAPAEDAARKKVCQQAVEFVKEPSYLIRHLSASDMSGPQSLAWLDILYGDKERMTPEFSRRQLTALIGLPQGSLTQAERALRIESVLTLVRHGADHLQGIDLRGARNFMLEQLRAMQEDIASLDDGQPSIDHTELYLRTSQAITALYTPAIFGRAMNLQWAFQPPANDAPQAQTDAFLAKVRDHVDAIHATLDALVSDIDDMQTRMDRETRRTDNEKALLALRQGLTALTPPPPQAPAWLATLDMTVLNFKRASLLPETFGQLRAAMGGLRSTLQGVVRMATEGTAPPAPSILNSPVQPQPQPEVEGLG